MPLSPALVLIDDGFGSFGPLCDLAGAAELRTGAWSTREWLERHFGRTCEFRVGSPLRDVTRESVAPAGLSDSLDGILVVNARCADRGALAAIAELDPGAALTSGEAIVAARLDRRQGEPFLATGTLPNGTRTTPFAASLLTRPWDVLAGLGAAIAADVRALVGNAEYASLPDPHPSRMGAHPILVHRAATVAPYVVFDATAGPIHVAANCTIRPFAVVCGPCSIGPHSIVADRSLIKPNVTCGPHCRLGGEISGTSIAGYSNKTHDGHLGDSILGSWVNLGAGTDNSNLLNTYGDVPIRLEPDGPRERTGRTFLGAVIGDHVKCAIGTRLMTGTVLGTGAMIASSKPPPATTRRFAWITDEGERQYALPKFLDVARTVMARRGITPGPAYLARLSALHAETGR